MGFGIQMGYTHVIACCESSMLATPARPDAIAWGTAALGYERKAAHFECSDVTMRVLLCLRSTKAFWWGILCCRSGQEPVPVVLHRLALLGCSWCEMYWFTVTWQLALAAGSALSPSCASHSASEQGWAVLVGRCEEMLPQCCGGWTAFFRSTSDVETMENSRCKSELLGKLP